MKKLVAFLEYSGGGLLFVVMTVITASSISRYMLNAPLMDSDEIARLLLLPAIFFGLAGACHHAEHIQVDLLWVRLSRRGREIVDYFADVVMTLFVATMAFAAVWRVLDIKASRVGTYELRLPMWPFFAVASIGLILSAVVLLRRLLAKGPPGSGRPADDRDEGLA
jgi:C4-dicarboxylate transporter, DctQ subunit